MKTNLGAIILAAGKGSRMKSKKINKVAMHLADKPMILHSVELLKEIKVKHTVVVVGFAKNSVMKLLDGGVIFAEQKKRLGTAHAVITALKKLPQGVDDVLVINGDDSAFYTKEIIKKLVDKQYESKAAFTFLTIERKNPAGLGRVVRSSDGRVLGIVEEKDASTVQRKITEVNPACYIFKVNFLRKYLPFVEKSSITGEYYLTSLIELGIKNKEKVETLPAGNLAWRGINTRDELLEAETLINKYL